MESEPRRAESLKGIRGCHPRKIFGIRDDLRKNACKRQNFLPFYAFHEADLGIAREGFISHGHYSENEGGVHFTFVYNISIIIKYMKRSIIDQKCT